MAETVICDSCKYEMEDKINLFFCPKCLTQVKCKTCNALLLKDAVGCIECGASINSASENGAVNKIDFEQKGESRKFSATFTDNVGHSLVNSLSTFILGSQQKTNKSGLFSNDKILKNRIESNIDDAEILDEEDVEQLSDVLGQIFKLENDKLRLINPRLKQAGKLDHAARITLLLLYAYHQMGRNQVPRSDVNEVLSNAKVYDGNFRQWIGKCDEITRLPDDKLELSLPGTETAKEILKELLDTSVEKGKTHFKKGSSRRKKAKKEDTVDGVSKPNETKSSKKSSGKLGVKDALLKLISEGYFKQRRVVSEISKHLKDDKAISIGLNPISTALGRLIKDGTLKRERNKDDSQYEYFKSV